MLKLVFACVALLLASSSSWATSVFTSRPDDPAAVYVDPPDAQSAGDHHAMLQAALDRAGASPMGGIVFVPSGRYRITRTLVVWSGVRVVGYGATRPVLVLPERTPGFQTGIGLMVHFTSARPGPGRRPGAARAPLAPPGLVPPADDIPDANQSTFYSSMMNIDVEIGEGNPAAVAIRFHVAQHGVLAHMDFHTGSGLAALTDIGNVGQQLRFYGGRYGILTSNTSPFWPYTLIDSVFDGQREAAIREHMAGLTVVRTTFRNVPVGISIDRDYSDQLWLKDARFENIANAAIVIDKEWNPTTQVGVADAICSNVPVFARYREGGRTRTGPATAYRVTRFHHGLFVRGTDSTGAIESDYVAEPLQRLPAALPPAIRPLPPTDQWVNVRALGMKGDGQTDDTQALQAAIDAHRVLYFPSGFYIVRDTIRLKPDTVLIALHPHTTQLDLPDRTSGFAGVGPPKALLEAPQGGTNIVSGLGLFTGATNPRATAVLWMAGRDSLLDDIQIHGFAGTFMPPAVSATLFGAERPSGSFGRGRWGAQYPSIWVTRGGGGTFHNIWSPNTYARSGFYVSDTTTPGYVYELSAEHHLFSEIALDRVENWEFYGPQTEEEASEGGEAVAFEIADSKNITIANYHAYRVTRSYAPFPTAVRVSTSSGVRFRNVYVNAEHGYGVCDANGCGTFLRAGKFAYDNALEDVSRGRQVRERNFAVLDLDPPLAATAVRRPAPVVAPGAAVEKLAGGFHSIAGAAVDASGTLFFVDRHQHRILVGRALLSLEMRWMASRTGSSTDRRPKRKRRRATRPWPSRSPTEEHHDRQLPRVSCHAQLRAVRDGGPRLHVERHRFRNVYVNAEHGYGVCDANGCGTFLRTRKFAYDDALRTSPRGRQVRERNFAVLDSIRSPAATAVRRPAPVVAPGAAVEKLAGGFHCNRRRGGGRLGHAVLRRSPPAPDLLVVAGDPPEGRARRAARPGEPRRRSIRQPAGALLGRPGGHRVHVPARRPARRARRPAAPATPVVAGRRIRHPRHVLGGRPVQEPPRPRHLRVRDARADARPRRDHSRAEGLRDSGWQPPDFRPVESSRRDQTARTPAWTRPDGDGRTPSTRTA